MPEMYEVQRIKHYLTDEKILSNPIRQFEFLNRGARILKNMTPDAFEKTMAGQSIERIDQKAKYLVFIMTNGALLLHLRFTGIPHIAGKSYKGLLNAIHSLPVHAAESPSARFRVTFTHGNVELVYIDTRCLSHMKWYSDVRDIAQIPDLADVAPDLDGFLTLTPAQWQAAARHTRTDIKTWLQNQKTPPSGIGNYLACEILAEASLSPWKKTHTLSEKEWNSLYHSIMRIRGNCLASPGYTWFKVYKKKQCGRCGSPVNRLPHRQTLSSQSTYYCPECQKK